ncbi:MAG: ABC transporter substrate-binding protein [Pseudonocardiales bacterium]|nr:ABC transporter substrate-binding protein [Pseudonocardiales bacterium]
MAALPTFSPVSRRGFLGLAGGAAALALAGCGSSEPTTAAAGAPRTIRTCVYAKNHASSPLFWQRFAPQGWTVDVKIVTSSAEIQTALESGNLDFGLIGTYSTILAKDQGGFNSKIIGMCARQGIGLVGRKGVVTDVASLKGRKIAVPPPGQQVLTLNVLLERAGLKLNQDVTGVPLGYADHPGALQRGDVDAFIGTEPLCTQSVVAGVGERLPAVSDTPVGDFNTAIWASPAMLKEPEVCRTVAGLQKQAAEYLTPGGQNDRAVWKDLLVTQFGYSEQLYERVLENLGAEWKFDEKRQQQFQGAGEIMAKLGAIKAQPDYESMYARDYWNA